MPLQAESDALFANPPEAPSASWRFPPPGEISGAVRRTLKRAVSRTLSSFASEKEFSRSATVSQLLPSPSSSGSGWNETEQTVNAEVDRELSRVAARIDRSFALLMLIQWLTAIGFALWISPRSWAGDSSFLHPHVALAIFYGGVLTLVPVLLTRIAPGQRITRLTIAATQMLMSALLIHLTEGRIETHFHIFGSLAFLACYLDWEVLLVASFVIAADHVLRGLFLPISVFGTYTVQPWRWLEHAGWVVFCDIFLIAACISRSRGIRILTIQHIERGRLLHRAHYDALTDLPNRSYLGEKFHEFMHAARRQSAGFSCLYIDLDRFQHINDRMGHASGDRILRMAADRMLSALSPGAFLARVGGDEFVALVRDQDPCPDPGNSDLPTCAERLSRALLHCLEEPFEFEDQKIVLGASIGISRYPDHVRQEEEIETDLLSKSDQAMYRVKHSGRNDFLIYSPALFADSSQTQEAENQLRRAIENREFTLHYQPIFHADGPLAGFEALIRWVDPIRGNISPGEFIPLAERTGLIVQVGSFVLHEACAQATDWRSRGLLDGTIAVNVSSIELAREDFADSVMLTLSQHYTPPDAIEIEVTESALVQDFALAERHLRELRNFGIRISIDDFGTGYSSLGRLRQLTLDTLKIDRSFVDGVAQSDADRTVVEHIVSMAHTLSMSVIAEGVENQDQLDILRSLGCDQIQGFLLARPQNKLQTELLLAQLSLLHAHEPEEASNRIAC